MNVKCLFSKGLHFILFKTKELNVLFYDLIFALTKAPKVFFTAK